MNNYTNFAHDFIERAKEYSGVHGNSKKIKFGSKIVQLSYSVKGHFANQITSAFISAPTAKQVDAQIHIWDSSFPSKLPDFTFAEEYIVKNETIPQELSENYNILFDRGQGFIYVFNKLDNTGAIWFRDYTTMDEKCFVAPFRVLLSWIANQWDAEIVHAAAVEIDKELVLISGPSGSGKSSLSLIALQNDLRVVTDDAVLLENDGSAYPIYTKIKINEDNPIINKMQLSKFEKNQIEKGKLIIQLPNVDQLFSSLKVSSLVFPILAHVAGIAKIDGKLAGQFIFDHSLRELFGGLPENRRRLEKLINTTPCYRLAISGIPIIDLANLMKIRKLS